LLVKRQQRRSPATPVHIHDTRRAQSGRLRRRALPAMRKVGDYVIVPFKAVLRECVV
jgi:hypothetical protein